MPVSPAPDVRRELRPGDLGRIIAQHGRIYAPEYGVDATFEAHVAASVADAGKRGWPREREAVWIVEREGEHAGSLALTDEGDGMAALRWFVLDPALRGAGLGTRLVDELLELAEACGYERVGLETFSELRAAARIYRRAGFELQWAQTGPRWGHAALTYQRYELSFQRRAQSLSSESAGPRARPFSVSA
jgi:RimJ/RimL family protein N-acetyltransferase